MPFFFTPPLPDFSTMSSFLDDSVSHNLLKILSFLRVFVEVGTYSATSPKCLMEQLQNECISRILGFSLPHVNCETEQPSTCASFGTGDSTVGALLARSSTVLVKTHRSAAMVLPVAALK